ncbi:dihydrofolate reductase [Actinomadura darangshiensis]|uniref:Dihydrofolate reductase n=1 Tax=Actinomadura darangshiensis TaxID=705336 RepID=A0A4R5BGS4_9ACTN|nr:dihydrofolate reductase family protein [Actinomadura darangshiensis]TDD84513.1 dihydrofolate reductase [Actinomadura darangshiensis]
MRKIFAAYFVSLDGVYEAPQKWHFPYQNAQMEQAVAAQMDDSDTMLLGRRTYEEFAGAFMNADPSNALAAHMAATPKYVASTTLDDLEWKNSTLLKDDVPGHVARLKEEPGRDILLNGSATLMRSLLREGLVDELRLLVHPVVVGSGARLFEDVKKTPFHLADSAVFDNGVLSLRYEPR